MKDAKIGKGKIRVRVRPAVAQDKKPIVAFCKQIWGGHDYIPEVWDEWIKDRKARLLVATVNNMPVAVAHAYFQDKTTAWLEGVRVDPKYRGHGIAGRLNLELYKWARKNGAKVARLCTGGDNTASRNHLLKTGFEPLQTFARYTTTRPLKRKPNGTRRLGQYTKTFRKQLMESSMFDQYKGMYADGWTWCPLTPPNIRKLVRQKRVLRIVEDGTGPIGFAVGVPDRRGFTLGLATGSAGQIETGARYLRYLLKNKSSKSRIRALVPPIRSLENPLKYAGFKKTGATVVYERRVSHP